MSKIEATYKFLQVFTPNLAGIENALSKDGGKIGFSANQGQS